MLLSPVSEAFRYEIITSPAGEGIAFVADAPHSRRGFDAKE
jgi:hypothetical protein